MLQPCGAGNRASFICCTNRSVPHQEVEQPLFVLLNRRPLVPVDFADPHAWPAVISAAAALAADTITAARQRGGGGAAAAAMPL